MSDPTLKCLINKEQYDFLKMERKALEELAALGSCKNLDQAYLIGCRNITTMIYGNPVPVNINCNTCIKQMLRPLLHQIHEYEKQK